MFKILIVDDEANIRNVLKKLFELDGFEVSTAADGCEGLFLLKDNEYSCIISDLRMPKMDGMQFFKKTRSFARHIPFIFITAYGSIEDAVAAIKSGAADFISKPFNKNVIREVVNSLLSPCINDQGFQKNEAGLVYTSQCMAETFRKMKKIARTNLTVCISGESGTGKEGLAKTLHHFHQQFQNEESPFVSINCPAIPETLLESEIFGYKKGAFSGASADFEGKIKRAGNGTLFLDEIADLPMKIQPKLLRLLEEKTFEPLGSNKTYTTNARFVCSTNQNLQDLVEEGKFRHDLYYRINSITVELPPLRDRVDDISILANYFLNEFCQEQNIQKIKFHSDCMQRITDYHWPGNVRELKNTIRAAAAISETGILLPDDLLPKRTSIGNYKNINNLKEHEKKILQTVLEAQSWNITAAARELKISRGSLRYKIEKFNLQH